MRKIVAMAMLALLVCAQRVDAQQSREFSQTVPLEAGGTLTFETDKGSVKLTGWERREVAVYARIEAPEDIEADYAQRVVAATRIDISGDARALFIRSNFDEVPRITQRWADRWGSWSRRTPDIHYEIKAPHELNLRLSADRSSVSAQGFTGRLSFETDRSPLVARDLAGDLQIKVDRGEVRLDNVRGGLQLNTDRTDTRVSDFAIERDSRLNVSRGEAELRLPDAQRFSVNARTGRRESFQSDFAITTRGFNSNQSEGRVEGTINGGGPQLAVEGDRSRVYLRRQ